MLKRTISIVLSLVMLMSYVTMVSYAAEEGTQAQSTSVDNDISMEGVNSLGSMLADELDESQSGESMSCHVSKADFNDEGKMIVGFLTDTDASLVVGIYSEDGSKMITSANVDITPQMSETEVEIPDFTEENYLIRAYIVEPFILAPLSKIYENDLHTTYMQEFFEKTVDDFDEDRVVNFDDDETNNFAVYSEDTKVVEEQEGVNTVVKADDENGEYILENINETVAGLSAGDIFAYQYGEDGFILIKVGSIEIDGNTAVIKSQETSLEEIFDYFRLEDSMDDDECTLSTEGIPDVVDSNFDEEPPVEPMSLRPVRTGADDGDGIKLDGGITIDQDGVITAEGGVTVGVTFGSDGNLLDKKIGESKKVSLKASFTGHLSTNISAQLKYYIAQPFEDSSKTYVEFSISNTSSIVFNITLKGSTEIPLFKLVYSFAGIVNLSVKPTLKLEGSISGELKGTLTMKYGIKYQNGEVSDISESPKFTPSIKIEGTISIGLDIGPSVYIISESVVKLHLKIEPKFVLKAVLQTDDKVWETLIDPTKKELDQQKEKDIHECLASGGIGCLAGTIDFKFTIGLDFEILKKKLPTDNISASISINLLSFYYSFPNNELGFDFCPHKKYYYTLKVTDDLGTKISDADVTITRLGNYVCSTATDSKGEAIVYLPVGSYIATIKHGEHLDHTEVITVTAEYVPDLSVSLDKSKDYDFSEKDASFKKELAATIAKKTQVKINGGKSRTGTVNMRRIPHNVAITLKDNNGESISGAKIKVKDMRTNEIRDNVPVSSSKDGYTAELPDGTYYLDAECFGYISEGGAEVTVNGSDTSAEIIMNGNPCRITAVDQDGDPVIGANILLKYKGLKAFNAEYRSIGKTNTQGVFYKGADTGDANITISKRGYDSYTGIITIPKGGTTLDVVMQNHNKKIKVYVVDEENNPLSDVSVYSYYDKETLTTDENGYVMLNVPVGDTKLILTKDGYRTSNTTLTAHSSNNEPVTFVLNASRVLLSEGQCSSNIKYKVYDDGTLILFGSGELSSLDLRNISYSFNKIIIEKGITSIGDSVFRYGTGITSVTIPDSVISIGHLAFEYCKSLTSLTIPDSVISIGHSAFEGCENLTSLEIPDSVVSIGADAFYGCIGISSLKIGNNVTTIGPRAFWLCTSLTSVTIPDNVTSMGEWAFLNCQNLTSVTIGNGITSIDERVFEHCPNLTSVTIPDSVTSIGDNAFKDCENLTSVTIGNGVTSIIKSAFETTPWFEEMKKENPLVIVNGILIDGSTYEGDVVVIPENVTSIGNGAFYECKNLTSVSIPDSVTSIAFNAFWRCTSLTSITIPDSVTSIDQYAFGGCTSLTSVIIPDSVTSIGEGKYGMFGAFGGCKNLSDIYYHGTEEELKNIISLEDNRIIYSDKVTIHYNSTGPTPAPRMQALPRPQLIATRTAALDGFNETLTNLIPNNVYNVYVVKTSEAEDMLSEDNLIYLVQTTASENGEIDLTFSTDKDVEGFSIITARAKHGMSAVEINLVEDIFDYTGEAQTLAYTAKNGDYELVEGVDYQVQEMPELVKPGYYNIVIEGIGKYYGMASKAFTIYCEHKFENSVCTTCGTECPHDYQDGICTICGAEEPTTEFLLGDVDGDGTISAMDASAALTYYVMNPATIEELGFPFNIKAADWDENGVIDARDASAILTYYVSH